MLRVSFVFLPLCKSFEKYFILQSKLVTINTLQCILILPLLKFLKAFQILLVALFVERKGKASYRKGYKNLLRSSVSNSSVLIYMNLFYQVIISSFMSTACLKPELNRSMKNCINGAIVKIKKNKKKTTKYQNLLERETRKLEKPTCRSMQTKDQSAVNQKINCTTQEESSSSKAA